MKRPLLNFAVCILPAAVFFAWPRQQTITASFPIANASIPALNEFLGKNGISFNVAANSGTNDRIFDLHPDTITTGSLITFDGFYADAQTANQGGGGLPACASHCDPTVTDNASTTLTAVFTHVTCPIDTNGFNHNIWLDPNVPTTTFQVKTHFPALVTNNSFNVGNFYNVNTAGTIDGSSCKVDVTPTNNTAPNISGTAYSITTANDLTLVVIQDEGSSLPAIGPVNPWGALTIPAGCTLLEENVWVGHAVMMCTPGVGTFTPTFTVSQTTHDPFAIMAVSYKPGSGGSTPAAGARVLQGQQIILQAGVTTTVNLPCPTSTKSIVMMDDAAGINTFTDSNSDTFTEIVVGAGLPNVWYKVGGISISNPNTFTITMHNAGGGTDLPSIYCSNVTSIDTGVTAGTGSTLTGANSGAVWAQVTEGTGSGNCQGTAGSVVNCHDNPIMVTSLANDLIFLSCQVGTGPQLAMSQPTGAVFDYPFPFESAGTSAATLATVTVNGDTDYFNNGDGAGHYFASTAGSINFGWLVQQQASAVGCLAFATH